MNTILALNGGSSSIKFSVFEEAVALPLLLDGSISGIGTPQPLVRIEQSADGRKARTDDAPNSIKNYSDAIAEILRLLNQSKVPEPTAVAHRIVHSGPDLSSHQEITEDVLRCIEDAARFAPLHEPMALQMIRDARRQFPRAKQYACFDTVFHQTMPEVSTRYPLPHRIATSGVRRYGFHGLSCESILPQLANATKPEHSSHPGRLVIAHLGGGSSVTAIENGNSVHNTMGLTPCGGLIMGTRSGDLDPSVIIYLIRCIKDEADPVKSVESALYKESGLLALSRESSDMKTLRKSAAQGSSDARLAIEIFVSRVVMAIGSYAALLSGIDELVFTGGIGEHDADTRAEVCAHLAAFGLVLDEAANRKGKPGGDAIHSSTSRVAVYVFPARENLVMAQHVFNLQRL